MKKILLFLFFSSHFSFAQDYIPFPDSNAVWTDYLVNVTCPQPSHICHVNRFYLNGDTVIGSYVYNKIYIISFGQGYHGAIRNDVPTKKVYFISHDTNVDTLLYDFDLEIGDTLTSTYLYNDDNFPEPSIISAIDSIYSGGIYRKQYHVYNLFLEMELVYLIEGIGSTGGLFEGFYYPEGMSQLMCFRYNDTLYYPEGGGSLFECEMPWQPPHCSDTTYLPTITRPLVVCYGDTIILEAQSGYDSYLWSTGDTTQSISVSDSGDFFVSALIDTCWFNSDTVEISISNPQPIVFEHSDGYLSTFFEFLSYQWYQNDGLIPDATEPIYCPEEWGYYYHVQVIDEFGCIGVSPSVEVASEWPTDCLIGIDDFNSSHTFSIYPNPASNQITIELAAGSKQLTVEIYNTMGQLVFQSNLNNQKSTISVENFFKGLYFFKVSAGEEVVVRKVVVE